MKTFIKAGIFSMMFFTSFLLQAQYNAGDYSGTSGSNRTFVGVNAGHNNTTGQNNTFYGRNSGYKNVAGASNSFFGVNSGYNNTGSRNTFIGVNSGRKTTAAVDNTFVGYNAGYSNRAGASYNTYIGSSAGSGSYTGRYNVAVGAGAGSAGGNYNTMLGRYAGKNNGGSSNTMLGYEAGYFNTGSGNVFIGYEAGRSGTNISNRLIIANNGTSTLVQGDFAASTLALYGKVGIGTSASSSYQLRVSGSAYATGNWTSSDKRYKKDIQTIDSALDKINRLNGVTYSFKKETINDIDFSKQKGEKHIGFVAQELEEVLPELVRKDEAGYYAVNYDGLIPVLVEGMKEQQEVVVEQEREIADLKSRLAKIEALLNTSETIQGNLSPTSENIDFSGVVLRQNAPNPFRGSTMIEYQLPENVNVASLVVSDLNGRTVATYTISEKGTVEFDANGLDSGIYVYAIIANGKSIASQKMVIQK